MYVGFSEELSAIKNIFSIVIDHDAALHHRKKSFGKFKTVFVPRCLNYFCFVMLQFSQ